MKTVVVPIEDSLCCCFCSDEAAWAWQRGSHAVQVHTDAGCMRCGSYGPLVCDNDGVMPLTQGDMYQWGGTILCTYGDPSQAPYCRGGVMLTLTCDPETGKWTITLLSNLYKWGTFGGQFGIFTCVYSGLAMFPLQVGNDGSFSGTYTFAVPFLGTRPPGHEAGCEDCNLTITFIQ